MDKWDKRFVNMAKLIATWSKDPSSKIGAIAVDDNHRILGTGYNGFNRFDDDLLSDYYIRDIKYSKIIHAEKNLILNCLNSGVSLEGATVYVYGLPVCKTCANEIAQVGLKRLVAVWDHNIETRWEKEWTNFSEPALKSANITVRTAHREIPKPVGIVAVEVDGYKYTPIMSDGTTGDVTMDVDADLEEIIRSMVEQHG